MKISTRGRYALLLMIDLAAHYGTGPVALREAAQRQGLSEHYLEQLMGPLRSGGLVHSVRGAAGGYYLAKHPEEITAGHVIRQMEGPTEVVAGLDPAAIDAPVWLAVNEAIDEALNRFSLAELAHGEDEAAFMFYI
ncbi:MAG: Rrf2 family transcriptional regulator [Firmicutes bacterium]|nr:Rrf2 family transcriptional regulator [Bacillota bacterium]